MMVEHIKAIVHKRNDKKTAIQFQRRHTRKTNTTSQVATKKFKFLPGLSHRRSLQKFGIGNRKCQKLNQLKPQKTAPSQAKN